MDELRTKIGKAILAQMEADYERHGTSYDPDSCYAAADRVIALLVGELLDVDVEARHHPSIIGPARFVARTADGEVLLPVSDNYL